MKIKRKNYLQLLFVIPMMIGLFLSVCACPASTPKPTIKKFGFKNEITSVNVDESLELILDLDDSLDINKVIIEIDTDNAVLEEGTYNIIGKKEGTALIIMRYEGQDDLYAELEITINPSLVDMDIAKKAEEFDKEVENFNYESSTASDDYLLLMEKYNNFNERIKILIKNRNMMYALEAEIAIASLPKEIKFTDEEKVTNTRKIYRSLEYGAQVIVRNYQVLVEKEEALKEALAKHQVHIQEAFSLDEMISKLNSNPKYEDILDILIVKDKYDALHEDAKSLVKNIKVLNNIFKKIEKLQDLLDKAETAALQFDASVKAIPNDDASIIAKKEIVKEVITTYYSLSDEVLAYVSYDSIIKLNKCLEVLCANKEIEYLNLDEIKNISDEIINSVPKHITFDYKFPTPSVSNAFVTWEYVNEQDKTIHDLTTGAHFKELIKTYISKVRYTFAYCDITITKEIDVNYGALETSKRGLYYGNDPRVLSADETGSSDVIGWSKYSITYGAYTIFLLKGNVFGFSKESDLTNASIENPLYATLLINNASSRVTLDFSTLKDANGNSYFGNGASVISNGVIKTTYKTPTKIILEKGESIYLTKTGDNESIKSNFLSPASNLKINNSLVIKNYDEEYLEYTTILNKEMIIVDNALKTVSVGTIIERQGVEFKMGETAFSSIAEALEKVSENGIIYVYKGDYRAEELTIKTPNIKITTANAKTQVFVRNDEVILGKVNINAVNVELNGLVINDKVTINALGSVIAYSYFTSNATLNYLKGNATVTHSYFEKNDDTILTMEESSDLTFTKNIVKGAKNVIVIAKATGIIKIDDNVIENVTESLFNSPDTSALEVFINRNNIKRVMGEMIVINGKSHDGILNINIMYNTFITTPKMFNINIVDENNKGSINVKHNIIINNNHLDYVFKDVVNSASTMSIAYDRNYSDLGEEIYSFIFNTKVSVLDNLTNVMYKKESVKEDLIYPVGIEIAETLQADLFGSTPITFDYIPHRSNVLGVTFVSMNEKILTIDKDGVMHGIKKGEVQVKAYLNYSGEMVKEFTVKVDVPARIELRYESTSWVLVNDDLRINAMLDGLDASKLVWEVSDEKIAVIENGTLSAKAPGIVMVKAYIPDTEHEMTLGVTVLEKIDEVTKMILEANNSEVMVKPNILVTGYKFVYYHDILSSVSKLFFGNNAITEYIAPLGSNRPGTIKESTEFITVHDTASSESTADALAHAKYVADLGGGGTSWHYSVGNDGIYHQMPDNEVAYHAGDGTDVKYGLLKTKVLAEEVEDVKITIDAEGYYLINNKNTGIKAPTNNGYILKTSAINDIGIHYVVGDDGYYYLGKTYYNGTYQKISNYGGNNNSIGIETCVNQGSDLYMTWQKTANLVAKLLMENNLDTSRVKPHHFFSGKNCPETMRDNKLWYHFMSLVEAEYNRRSNFAEYTITAKSNSLDHLRNNGRTYDQPLYSECLSYTVTIEKEGYKNEITLFSVLPGVFNN